MTDIVEEVQAMLVSCPISEYTMSHIVPMNRVIVSRPGLDFSYL